MALVSQLVVRQRDMIPNTIKRESEMSLINLSETCLQDPPIASELNNLEEDILSYPNHDLYHELAVVLGKLHKVPIKNIVFGNGAAELIDIVTAYSPFRDVIILTPSFFLYEVFARKHGLKVHKLNWPWSEDLLNLQKIVAKTSALVWIVNPNNPTAHLISEDQILNLVENSDCLVAVDESFADFSNTSLAQQSVKMERLIVIRSFSKAFGLAGARVGYCIGKVNILGHIRRIMDPLSASRIGVSLAIKCTSEMLPLYKSKWDEILTQVPEFASSFIIDGVDILTGPCNFICLKFRQAKDAMRFYDLATQFRLSMRAGWHWEFSGHSKSLIRVTVPVGTQYDKSLSRIRNVISAYQEE